MNTFCRKYGRDMGNKYAFVGAKQCFAPTVYVYLI
jgi:hypothetical protein